MSKKSILSIGDAMLDIVVLHGDAINFNSDSPSQITIQSGGAAANTAAWLSTANIDSHFAGRVGDDIAGEKLISDLENQGVTCHITKVRGANSGIVVALVDGEGNRTMFPDSGANSGLDESVLPAEKDFSGYYLSGYALFNPASTPFIRKLMVDLRSSNAKIFFDPASVGIMNLLGSEKALELIGNVDVIFVNEDEATYLSLEKLKGIASIVVIKKGPLGASAITRGGLEISKPALSTEVIDTTGAGDAFAAGFIAEWLNSEDLSTALDSALSLAAQCVSNIGARPRVIT